jgi:copper chaperone CopZ
VKTLLVSLLLVLGFYTTKAQFTYAEVGINGLTCSQCSRNVEMSIRKLPFVKDVEMNLAHTEGKIFFVKSGKVDIDKIAQAVRNAGFSVRYLKAGFVFGKTTGSCFTYQGDTYSMMHVPANLPDSAATITFIGSAYQARKDFKKWQTQLGEGCKGKEGKLYYITL